ncbi:hypothetical protein BJ741DRAFT_654445 [Chytriomyces cf. hyalinus JEL632]|nr:hypothetical protein BJ741DRAFT_654445 [Chytriomyces cf. hyalinus JEL632]
MPLKRVHSHAPSKQSSDALRLNALERLVDRHEISKLMALKLRKLEAYDIVVICDDSGSMNTKSTAGLSASNPFAPIPTRWDELKETVTIVTDIACALDGDGIDIYFLNRAAFQYGAPTDDSGDDDKDRLKDVLTKERSNKVPAVFLACTDDDEEVGYLNEWDIAIPGVDVVDDFCTERRQVKAVQGPQFPFSRGDWVCKMLLGPVDPEIDMLDEVPLARPLARKAERVLIDSVVG